MREYHEIPLHTQPFDECLYSVCCVSGLTEVPPREDGALRKGTPEPWEVLPHASLYPVHQPA